MYNTLTLFERIFLSQSNKLILHIGKELLNDSTTRITTYVKPVIDSFGDYVVNTANYKLINQHHCLRIYYNASAGAANTSGTACTMTVDKSIQRLGGFVPQRLFALCEKKYPLPTADMVVNAQHWGNMVLNSVKEQRSQVTANLTGITITGEYNIVLDQPQPEKFVLSGTTPNLLPNNSYNLTKILTELYNNLRKQHE